ADALKLTEEGPTIGFRDAKGQPGRNGCVAKHAPSRARNRSGSAIGFHCRSDELILARCLQLLLQSFALLDQRVSLAQQGVALPHGNVTLIKRAPNPRYCC